jgi:pyridoxine kinase
MERNGLAGHTHILTGYAGRADLLHALARVVNTTTRHCPDAVYRTCIALPAWRDCLRLRTLTFILSRDPVCDPVMGDNGKLYVAEEVVGIYADELVPLAHMITPNHFEAEYAHTTHAHTHS